MSITYSLKFDFAMLWYLLYKIKLICHCIMCEQVDRMISLQQESEFSFPGDCMHCKVLCNYWTSLFFVLFLFFLKFDSFVFIDAIELNLALGALYVCVLQQHKWSHNGERHAKSTGFGRIICLYLTLHIIFTFTEISLTALESFLNSVFELLILGRVIVLKFVSTFLLLLSITNNSISLFIFLQKLQNVRL